jgi:hypothetical protein
MLSFEELTLIKQSIHIDLLNCTLSQVIFLSPPGKILLFVTKCRCVGGLISASLLAFELASSAPETQQIPLWLETGHSEYDNLEVGYAHFAFSEITVVTRKHTSCLLFELCFPQMKPHGWCVEADVRTMECEFGKHFSEQNERIITDTEPSKLGTQAQEHFSQNFALNLGPLIHSAAMILHFLCLGQTEAHFQPQYRH